MEAEHRMIQKERLKTLNTQTLKKREFVLYWMQASQRSEDNHALEYAIDQANDLDKPLVVYFGLTDTYPEANERHYVFMLEGLKEVAQALADRGIQFILVHQSPEGGIIPLAARACLVVVDRGYTRIQKQWREIAAKGIDCPLIQVETDAVVPVEEASVKEEYGAFTIRPKIQRKLGYYLSPLKKIPIRKESLALKLDSAFGEDIDRFVKKMKIDRTIGRIEAFRGGPTQAKKLLRKFTEEKLDRYPELSNDPSADCVSHLSPYLHFGQISPLRIALEVKKRTSPGGDAFLEELIVRRELSMNFVFFNPRYDDFGCLPPWAIKTLGEHAKDEREYVYSQEDFEAAATHDPYWNAAQREMMSRGKMHGYMRMYWGKKIIEWTETPVQAFKTALYLNNKYELDGRDPNGFTGVAWCFGKHDRAWSERPVFGKIRYMNAKGLRRKFDIDSYVRRVDEEWGRSA
jgi:deoxyribodipyrimidine photo-lyase